MSPRKGVAHLLREQARLDHTDRSGTHAIEPAYSRLTCPVWLFFLRDIVILSLLSVCRLKLGQQHGMDGDEGQILQ